MAASQAPIVGLQRADSVESFYDALSEPDQDIDLETALAECDKACKLFFCNDLEGALKIAVARSEYSLYHSLGRSIFELIPAMLSFDRNQIRRAKDALTHFLQLCARLRRSSSLVETLLPGMTKQTYTDMQAHAELCTAEGLLIQALLTIMETEDLTGLLKATFNIRTSYSTYRVCKKIMADKVWGSNTARDNFESGTLLGTAMFKLIMSQLPPKIIAVLEVVGFRGDRRDGLLRLEEGSRMPGVRSVLCDMVILAYHLYVCQFTGAEYNLHLSKVKLEWLLTKYPGGAWFKLLEGRWLYLSGRYTAALQAYNQASAVRIYDNVNHICCWEKMWLHGLKAQWRQAAGYANILVNESSWSKTTYFYAKAAFLLQIGVKLPPHERYQLADFLKQAVLFKQRVAGKSLPMEKFILRRCARYTAQSGHLVLPGIELLCLWNLFPTLTLNNNSARGLLAEIVAFRSKLDQGLQAWEGDYGVDNRALAQYLHGSCLRVMGLPHYACEELEKAFAVATSGVKEDTFLAPYIMVERAYCQIDIGNYEDALALLYETRKRFSGYLLESRLLFRVHSKIEIIKNLMDE